MKGKEFPSQKKYRMNNPSITFRLKKGDKEKLDAIIKASDIPLSTWMTHFVHDMMDPNRETSALVKKIHELEELNKVLATERRFNVPCPACGRPMYFSSNQSNWKTEIYPILKEAFSTSHHTTCKPK
ncbi:MAG: hypothetical protein WAK75_08085 [Methanoregula sp.]|uniref:hypothetical protein n=1 Tax=Methanoregula sp. TaxID=2052170 RepID=UPI003BB13F16